MLSRQIPPLAPKGNGTLTRTLSASAGVNDRKTRQTVYAASPVAGLEILSCTDDRQFSPHLHDGYVLWLNSAGGEHFTLNRSTAILPPGSLSIIEPGLIHANRPCGSNNRHLRSFYFSETFLAHISEKITARGISPALPTCVIPDRPLWRLFVELHETLLHSSSALQTEVDLLIGFGRLLAPGQKRETLSAAAAERKRIKTVIDFFHANIDRQVTLDEVAGLLQCTSYHLIRLFRTAKGVSPHSYLLQLRLEHARKLLAEGHAIIDAALCSGFADQSHLTRTFKARFGVTPGRYQQQRCR